MNSLAVCSAKLGAARQRMGWMVELEISLADYGPCIDHQHLVISIGVSGFVPRCPSASQREAAANRPAGRSKGPVATECPELARFACRIWTGQKCAGGERAWRYRNR